LLAFFENFLKKVNRLDSRIEAFAKVLVHHSVEAKTGENILIHYDNNECTPLIEAVYKEVLSVGAYPACLAQLSSLEHILMDSGNKAQINNKPDLTLYAYKQSQKCIGIYGGKNHSDINPDNFDLRRKAVISVARFRLDNRRWVACYYPTELLAEMADMNLLDYQDFVFNAVMQDWPKIEQDLDKIKSIFDNKKGIRIIGKNTDITFSLENRLGLKCFGKRNMPDGELCFAPIENSMNGLFAPSWPIEIGGKYVERAELTIKNGEIIHTRARYNLDTLNTALKTDQGSKVIGEFGIGFNKGITDFTYNTLFDEKIFGTVHFAFGSSIDGTGGTNKSLIHEDMVIDLRQSGEIYVDNEIVFKNGKYLDLE